MAYSIIKNHIPGLPKDSYRHGIGAWEGVVAHATDSYGDSDEGETNYFKNNWEKREAFVHYFVDDNSITETADPNYTCWGAGHVANQRYVSVELCQTKDSNKFKSAYNRYVWLIANLLYQKRLGVKFRDTLWGHDDVSHILGGTNHTDPYAYLASHGVSKEQFIQDVTNEYNSYFKKEATKVAEQTVSDWAVKAQKWVEEKDISDGDRPKDPVTREELWTMLYRMNGGK